jgi:hypothetical protein
MEDRKGGYLQNGIFTFNVQATSTLTSTLPPDVPVRGRRARTDTTRVPNIVGTLPNATHAQLRTHVIEGVSMSKPDCTQYLDSGARSWRLDRSYLARIWLALLGLEH